MPSVTLEVADGKNRSDTACRPGFVARTFLALCSDEEGYYVHLSLTLS